MKVIRETIGTTTVLIQMMDDHLEFIGETQDDRATLQTGIEDEIKLVYVKAKSVIKDIAEDIGAEPDSLRARANARPK